MNCAPGHVTEAVPAFELERPGSGRPAAARMRKCGSALGNRGEFTKRIGSAGPRYELWATQRKTSARQPPTMGSPQDPRTARRKRERRAKKNAEWELKRAQENAQAAAPKTPAKTAT